MSKIVYDALLTAAVAMELDARLTGARARGLRLDGAEQRVFLATGVGTLAWRLHPIAGGLTLMELRVEENVSLPGDARIAAVRAPADERTIEIVLESGDRPWGFLCLELAANARNAVLAATDGRIMGVLNERRRGARRVVAGEAYARRSPPGRAGATAPMTRSDWLARLGGFGDLAELRKRLLHGIAWTSPLNADYILGVVGRDAGPGSEIDRQVGGAALHPIDRQVGGAALQPIDRQVGGAALQPIDRQAGGGALQPAERGVDGAELGEVDRDAGVAILEAARERWLKLAAPVWAGRRGETGAWQPCVSGRAQPYVHPLGSAATAYPTILAAIEAAAGAVVPEAVEEQRERMLLQLENRLQHARRRAAQLAAELSGADREAIDLRRKADLLLAQLQRVERGSSAVELDDFEGGTVVVELDPARDAASNANALYERARRRGRAATRLPPMIARARAEAARLETLMADVAAGRVAPDPLSAGGHPAGGRSGRRPGTEGRALPYRSFRTSGGLEVRVGRSGRANDELTLHHARPTDIWMHARDHAGAHVVLRWASSEANPPHADLVEAAVLAALHSRARTSGVVPVDWTRKKYVRKPRRSPPGRVTIERAKTLFVEPSESLAEGMRQDQD